MREWNVGYGTEMPNHNSRRNLWKALGIGQ
jgi:hypothetical protein